MSSHDWIHDLEMSKQKQHGDTHQHSSQPEPDSATLTPSETQQQQEQHPQHTAEGSKHAPPDSPRGGGGHKAGHGKHHQQQAPKQQQQQQQPGGLENQWVKALFTTAEGLAPQHLPPGTLGQGHSSEKTTTSETTRETRWVFYTPPSASASSGVKQQ